MIGVKFSDPSIMSSHDIEESAINVSLDMSSNILVL